MAHPAHYPTTYEKAKLLIEGGAPIDVLFNPTEYKIAKANTWNYKAVAGKSLPKPEFGGGMPRVISLTLLLDRSLLGPEGSVLEVTDRLFAMMELPAGREAGGPSSAPPFVTFQWGVVNTFKAACTSLSVTFQLFHPNGDPIRAEVALELKQAAPAEARSGRAPDGAGSAVAAGAAAAAGAPAGPGVHAVQDGDSLPSVAQAAYGTPSAWREIAEASGVDNPLHLPRGLPLTIPPLALPPVPVPPWGR